MSTAVRLTKTATEYATADGRWTVEPVTMGGGANGIGGWSPGRREWRVTDTSGLVRLSGGGSYVTVERLYQARDLIAAYQRAE